MSQLALALEVGVEGGGQVHSSFLEADIYDDVVVYMAPKIVGGPAPSWVGGKGVKTMAAATKLIPLGPPVPVGDDLRLRFVPVRAKVPHE